MAKTYPQDTLKAMKASFSMTRQRCYNPKCRDYPYYGGRGITICQRWLDSFDNLIEDMGVRPEGMTLERIDNDGPYCKENCRWVSRLEQSQNQRSNRYITWQGRTQSLNRWAAETGIYRKTLAARIDVGYSLDDVFGKPVKCGAKLPGKVYPKKKAQDPSTYRRGLDNYNVAFSKETVLFYRKRWLQGDFVSSLAAEAGVSVSTMTSACKGTGAYIGI